MHPCRALLKVLENVQDARSSQRGLNSLLVTKSGSRSLNMRRRLKMGHDDDDVRGSEVIKYKAEEISPGLELLGTQLRQVDRGAC